MDTFATLRLGCAVVDALRAVAVLFVLAVLLLAVATCTTAPAFAEGAVCFDKRMGVFLPCETVWEERDA